MKLQVKMRMRETFLKNCIKITHHLFLVLKSTNRIKRLNIDIK